MVKPYYPVNYQKYHYIFRYHIWEILNLKASILTVFYIYMSEISFLGHGCAVIFLKKEKKKKRCKKLATLLRGRFSCFVRPLLCE